MSQKLTNPLEPLGECVLNLHRLRMKGEHGNEMSSKFT